MKNVRKSFDGFCALDGLNMTVPTGGIYGLVGPNGAGKSTAIRHLTGVYRPDEGQVLADGVPVYENEGMKTKIGCIPDEIFFFPSAGMEEMHRFYRGIYPAFDENLYRQLTDVFRLPVKGPIRRFSKGMQKQAAFQLAISCRPEILILDEPVDGLDPVMRRQVWSLLAADVAQHDMTVLISSHNLRELEDICDHVGIMDHGKMLLERSLEQMQGSTVKVQLVGQAPENLEILHSSQSGRLTTLVVRGTADEVEEKLRQISPVYFDVLPLSLEEIFIYELGGVDYEVRNIVF